MERNRHTFKEWLIAVRPWSFPASAMPVVVTLGYVFWKSSETALEINWLFGIWALVNIVIFHAAGNTWSDYFDFKKSVDAEDTFGVKTLTSGMFTPEEIKRLSIGLLAVALAAGLALVFLTGLPLLWIGIGGAVCSLLYPALKYRALGDLVILVSYALLPPLGTAFVSTGEIIWDTLWLSVPVGLITVAILHANNTRDMATDKRAGISTFAMELGKNTSRRIYYLEIAVPFVWTAACSIAGIFPIWSLVALVALLPASRNIAMMHKSKTEGMKAISMLDEMTAKLQMVFSLLLTVSFVIAFFL